MNSSLDLWKLLAGLTIFLYGMFLLEDSINLFGVVVFIPFIGFLARFLRLIFPDPKINGRYSFPVSIRVNAEFVV